MDLQAQVDALSTATMTTPVRAALGSEAAEVGTWACRALQGGVGVASAGVFRVGGPAGLGGVPTRWSLVLKVTRPPTPDKPTARMELDERHLLYWRREAHAYQSGLLDDLPPG